ncbi:MAG TPA: hypothetical protein ENJ20_06150 [Bacteroidetes bacterium]|nr:hypothetical protein [Bacteroidota bacterium]
MKTFKKISFLTIGLAALLLASNGCKNKEDETPEIKKGDIHMHFKYTVNGQDLQIGQVYEINGTAVSFEFANFYLGKIVFHPEQGSHISLGDQYLLVTPDRHEHSTTQLDAGHYHKVEFIIGVDDKENDQTETDFTNRSPDDPLAMQNPSMHWGWNGGYKYIRIDGMTDTDADGTPDTPLGYHLGNFDMFDFIQNYSFDLHHEIVEGKNVIEFEFDLAKLFTGIDLSTQTDTHVFNDVELAKIFHANLGNAITLL